MRRRSKRLLRGAKRAKKRLARALRRRAGRRAARAPKRRKACASKGHRASKRRRARAQRRRTRRVVKSRSGSRRVLAVQNRTTKRWIVIKENRDVAEAKAEFRVMKSYRDCTHLIRAERFFRRKGKGCIAMEWAAGPTLREAIRRGPFAPAQAAAVALGVLAGLSELHRAGYVHGDLHAGNVIVTDLQRGAVKIIDFQHAVPIGPRGRAKAKRKLSKPPPDLAPESKRGFIDVRYDIYGVGYMTAAMLLGREPKGRTWRSLLSRTLAKKALPGSAAARLGAVALKGAHSDRRKRYPSAGAMAEAIAAAVAPGAADSGAVAGEAPGK